LASCPAQRRAETMQAIPGRSQMRVQGRQADCQSAGPRGYP
jgi:hypothetical protein